MKVNWKNPDYSGIWRLRDKRLQRIRSDPAYYDSLTTHYKYNPVDFINDWGTTTDPRRDDPLMPFILFPKQVDFIIWLKTNLDAKQNCLVEKSRDMGITWLCIAFAIWLWLFWDGRKIGFGSRKEMLVDRLGDPDSIFEKIRMFLKYLPREFLPHEFDIDDHCPFLKIINPANGSTMTGEAGDNIGRGGRSTIYFKDESPFYERPDKIESAVSFNTDVQVDVGTPNGTGNPFYQKRMRGKIPVFTFHWKDDPRKDDAWYEKKKDEYDYDPLIIARELDIDYAASVERVCIPAQWVRAAVGFKLEDTGMKIAALDVADDGGDENVLTWRKGIVMKGLEAWKEGNTTQTARKAYGLCKLNKLRLLNYDSGGPGAGVKGEMWSINQEEGKTNVVARGINAGGKVYEGNYAPGKPNKDMFANLKAQLWWELRTKFLKVYNFRNHGKRYPTHEMISIINDPTLILQLSQQTFEFQKQGKIIMTKKETMKTKGIRSPDRADSVVMLYGKISGVDYEMLTQL